MRQIGSRRERGIAESWGLGMSWDEEIAVIGGNSSLEEMLLQAVGGERSFQKDFKRFSAYLIDLSDEKKQLVDSLLAQSGW